MALIRRTAGRRAPETIIIGPFDSPIPRYAWHRPAWSYDVSTSGLKAYQPRERAGEGAAIRDEFRWPDGTDAVAKWGIIWLAPEWPGMRDWEFYRRGGYRVDLRKLDPLSLRLSGGVQGHLWHLGGIPTEAVVAGPRGRRAAEADVAGAFLAAPEGAPFRACSTPEGAGGQCKDAAFTFARWLRARGEEVAVYNLGGCADARWTQQPQGFWATCPPASWIHYVVAWRGEVWDWSARQFDAAAVWPARYPVALLRRQWTHVYVVPEKFWSPVAGRRVQAVPAEVVARAEAMLEAVSAEACGDVQILQGFWIETHTIGCRNAADDPPELWWDRHWALYDEYATDGTTLVLGDPSDGKFVTITRQR